jgi:putative oxidoreductase
MNNDLMREHLTIDSRPVVLIRILVGWVFLAEGVLKFLRPGELGVGRFAKIGIPFPTIAAPFVGAVEIICGTLIIAGLLTRIAAIPLLIDIIMAIISTKLPILVGHGFWGFANPTAKPFGVATMLHEARTDISMLLGLVFLLIAGGGAASVDRVFAHTRRPGRFPKK